MVGSAELAAAQGMPESAAHEGDGRGAYERAYRDCPVDSLRALVQQGAVASDVARDYMTAGLLRAGDAVREAGEPRRYWDEVYAGCLAALTNEPSRYDTVSQAARARTAAARRHSQERESTLGSHAWVFYFDIALGALLFAAGAAFRHRDDDKTLRRWWVVASTLLGAFAGAFVFAGVGIMVMLFSMMSQPSERVFAALTAIAIIFGAFGIAVAPRRGG